MNRKEYGLSLDTSLAMTKMNLVATSLDGGFPERSIQFFLNVSAAECAKEFCFLFISFQIIYWLVEECYLGGGSRQLRRRSFWSILFGEMALEKHILRLEDVDKHNHLCRLRR
ncbi:hypothetical protein NPIL_405441 [Nephila pilipes]|uniref:Uncharacterized protein n=1 Tax=Nephila pilipes TaxID=299642 RepID=A0A8X6PF11_NEPPI|nr:hypothetical protein NPIL_405441 [Nephila pilipes]